MNRKLTGVLLILCLGISGVQTAAQQIPYLDDLLARSGTFYKLYTEKRKAGANLNALEPLRKRGEEQFRAGNIPGIIETFAEGTAMIQGQPWDERRRFLASLTIESDRLVLEPNQELHLSLQRIFPTDTDKAFPELPTVTFLIVPGGARTKNSGNRPLESRTLTERIPIGETQAGSARRLTLPDGEYSIVARIESNGQQVAEITQPLFAISDFSASLGQLSRQAAEIKSSKEPAVRALADLTPTVEFQIERLRPLISSRGDVEINPISQLDQIEAELTALARGQNPFASQRGELERAYRGADGRLVPYRLYVPASYGGKAASPLAVLLHGALGDERYFLSDLFDPETVKGEADRRGFILASVNGLGRFPSYRGPQAADAVEVVKAASREFQIDPARVFIAGHSLGGFGVWRVAGTSPDLFAALAPISGGPPEQGDALNVLLDKVKALPVLVVHGAMDGIVPPAQSRAIVERAQKAGLKVTYLEVPGADHIGIIGASFGAVLEFFQKHPKPAR